MVFRNKLPGHYHTAHPENVLDKNTVTFCIQHQHRTRHWCPHLMTANIDGHNLHYYAFALFTDCYIEFAIIADLSDARFDGLKCNINVKLDGNYLQQFQGPIQDLDISFITYYCRESSMSLMLE